MEQLRLDLLRFPAIGADLAHQALEDNPLEGRGDDIGPQLQIDQPGNDLDRGIGIEGGKHLVPVNSGCIQSCKHKRFVVLPAWNLLVLMGSYSHHLPLCGHETSLPERGTCTLGGSVGIQWGSDAHPRRRWASGGYHHPAPDKAFPSVDRIVLKKVIAKHSFAEGRREGKSEPFTPGASPDQNREPTHQGAAGSSNQKVLPFPTSLCTPIRPPWASTANLQKVSPRPVE